MIVLKTRGDYTGVARMETMIVKDGEVVDAVKKCRLVDNILNLTAKIEMVGEPVILSNLSLTSCARANLRC